MLENVFRKNVDIKAKLRHTYMVGKKVILKLKSKGGE